MAKSKTQRKGPGLLNKMMSNLHRPAPAPEQPTDERLAILAVELGLAGGEVLKEDFGFTDKAVARWLDAMLHKAKVNRVTALARMAVLQIDQDNTPQS